MMMMIMDEWREKKIKIYIDFKNRSYEYGHTSNSRIKCNKKNYLCMFLVAKQLLLDKKKQFQCWINIIVFLPSFMKEEGHSAYLLGVKIMD